MTKHLRVTGTPSPDVVDLWVNHCGKDQNGSWSQNPALVDCPACIEAFETEPASVTTSDLAEVVELLGKIAIGRNDVVEQAADLVLRLRRPRRAR